MACIISRKKAVYQPTQNEVTLILHFQVIRLACSQLKLEITALCSMNLNMG